MRARRPCQLAGGLDFEPYAPEFNYRVIKDLPAKEALQKAEQFVDCNSSYKSSRLTGIVDQAGHILGYEVRPLYFRDGRVRVSIRLNSSVERHLNDGGGDRDRN